MAAAKKFKNNGVCTTLSVTPCWCYGSETMDLDPLTIKAVWGFNGTERPGAVYLAAAMAACAQRGLPAFSIYGHDVQDVDDRTIPADVQEKILRFTKAAVSVGEMRNKAYVGIGSVAMGIAGSFLNPDLMQKYFGIRAEWVDMSEILRRIDLGIYDHEEYEKALAWTKANCKAGDDFNVHPHNAEQKAAECEFVCKMAIICRDIMKGNPKLGERWASTRRRWAATRSWAGSRVSSSGPTISRMATSWKRFSTRALIRTASGRRTPSRPKTILSTAWRCCSCIC